MKKMDLKFWRVGFKWTLCITLLMLAGCIPPGIWEGENFAFYTLNYLGARSLAPGIYAARVHLSDGSYATFAKIGSEPLTGDSVYKRMTRIGLLGNFAYESSDDLPETLKFEGKETSSAGTPERDAIWSASGTFTYSGDTDEFEIRYLEDQSTDMGLNNWVRNKDTHSSASKETSSVSAIRDTARNPLLIPKEVLDALRSSKNVSFTAMGDGNELMCVRSDEWNK